MAGLAAARHLVKKGAQVQVLEARDRVGGRIVNHHFADGKYVEVGGQWVGPTQDHAYALLEELGLKTFDTYEDGDHVVSSKGKIEKFTGQTYGLPPHVAAEVGLSQFRLETMAQEVDLEKPWTTKHAVEWDGESLETWLRSNLHLEESRAFWRTICAAIICCEASETSLLHFLFYIRSGGGLDSLTGTKGGAQEARIVGGSQMIAIKMAEQLGQNVHLNEPVLSIKQTDKIVTVTTAKGSYTGDGCIIAIPQHLIGNINFEPELPSRRQQLVMNVPMGAVIKIVATYKKPWWREEKFSGFGVSFDHPISITFDNSPADASCGMMVGFFEGTHARNASALSVEARRKQFIDSLVALYGPKAADYIEVVEKDWTAERWSGGCYGGHLGTGVWTQLGDELTKPFGLIEWAGTETAAVWNGYMGMSFPFG